MPIILPASAGAAGWGGACMCSRACVRELGRGDTGPKIWPIPYSRALHYQSKGVSALSYSGCNSVDLLLHTARNKLRLVDFNEICLRGLVAAGCD